MKKIVSTQNTLQRHWVGDGFPVRTVFHYQDIGRELSPFLLMDYAGPEEFKPNPSKDRRGVGEHPHRGFETVTIVYDGQVEHRDSAGGGGVIGKGDVQWMTAASGLVHEEMHGQDFTRDGGRFEMVQLWVNLPKKDKKAQPRYQGLRSSQIPDVELANGAGRVRVIAGQYGEHKGPAMTFTPINLWDLRLNKGKEAKLTLPAGHTLAFVVLSGEVRIEDKTFGEAEVILMEREGTEALLSAVTDAKLVVLSGQPIDEPVVGYGPFVMNDMAEIRQAFVDYQTGKMGQLPTVASS